MRAIYLCRNKACGHRWAVDYPLQERNSRGVMVSYRPDGAYKKYAGMDGICCERCRSGFGVKTVFVKATVTDHRCDDRCLDATGYQCLCSCGGKNHGRRFLCEPAAAA